MKVESLTIYPVKSLRGISCSRSFVEREGLRHDRRWMVVDLDGNFRTQRKDPRMATLATEIVDDRLIIFHEPTGSVSVPLHREGDPVTVTVWNFTGHAVAVSAEADQFLSEALGAPSRLVGLTSETNRPCPPDYSQADDRVSFADGFPILLANQASLDDLNSKLETQIGMDRFRPNIVVSGLEPWGEDQLESFQLGTQEYGPLRLRAVKPCGRCIVTTTDQITGERKGEEPLKTLATFRKSNNSINFGVNIIPDKEGWIEVGATD